MQRELSTEKQFSQHSWDDYLFWQRMKMKQWFIDDLIEQNCPVYKFLTK